jgi:hypothetical protein
MSLLNYFDSVQLKSILQSFNYWARYNRNNYLEKIESAITALYKWEDCPCDTSCECKKHDCKKHDCKKHLVRKPNVEFEVFYSQFLNCYVDEKKHNAVRKGTNGRGKNALEATNMIKENWHKYKSPNKTNLICTNWRYVPYGNTQLSSLKPGTGNIYLSKWMAFLSMGTYVAYDTTSVSKLKKDYKDPATYDILMSRIREDLILHLRKNNISIGDFCLYDNPNEFFKTIPAGSLKPLGYIVDKLYFTL